jgi:hypothetical protein
MMDSSYLHAISKAPFGLSNAPGPVHAFCKAHPECSILTEPGWGLAQPFFAASYMAIVI